MRRAGRSGLALFVSLAGCSAISSVDTSQLEDRGGTDAGPRDSGIHLDDGAIPPDTGGADAGPCMPVAEACGNGRDDDCDRLVDGMDPDCAAMPPPSDSCAMPARLVPGVTITGDTTMLENDVHPACARETTNAPDAVYSLGAAATVDAILSTFGSGYDTVLALRRRCEREDEEFACANDASSTRHTRIVYRSLPMGEYAVIVDGDRDRPAGRFQLATQLLPAPPQRTCDNAIDVTGGAAIWGSTNGGGLMDHTSGSCGGNGPAEETYTFELAAPTRVQIHTIGSGFDTVVYVRAGDCTSAGAEVACDDDGAGSTASRIDQMFPPGRYHVFVDGFDGSDEGNYVLVVYFG